MKHSGGKVGSATMLRAYITFSIIFVHGLCLFTNQQEGKKGKGLNPKVSTSIWSFLFLATTIMTAIICCKTDIHTQCSIQYWLMEIQIWPCSWECSQVIVHSCLGHSKRLPCGWDMWTRSHVQTIIMSGFLHLQELCIKLTWNVC